MAEPRIWMPNCEEYITLRKNTSGEFLDKILVGKQYELLDWTGAYAEVEYEGKRGYVLSSYIQPASENYLQSCLDLVRPSAVPRPWKNVNCTLPLPGMRAFLKQLPNGL